MGELKINFALRRIDRIKPFGKKPHLSLHWFGLTDGELWIDLGGKTIYEYRRPVRKLFGSRPRYNDYYLARFTEDLFGTFAAVAEPVPQKLYDNAETFICDMERWESLRAECDDAEFDRFYVGEFGALYDWFSARSFDSGYLVDGPVIGCFRCGDKIKIIWDSFERAEDGESAWTAPCGCFETEYRAFIAAIEDFFERFFAAMDGQVERAVRRDWGKIELDKSALVKEHADRRREFAEAAALLVGAPHAADWDGILSLYAKMRAEVDGLA